ncbi:MAG TPA: hypothetical protein VGN20_15340 [Mucilaginibacter sp.]|jgi:hypothetical protein
MTANEYISAQPAERQQMMRALHDAITAADPTVTPIVEPMMGKEMIIYKERGYMKYALSGVKNYMSLHCMPIYCNPALHSRYVGLLPAAKFQKGCVNFNGADELPIAIAANLISDCSKVSIADFLENRKKK